MTDQKKQPIQLTRKQAMGWAFIFFLVSASMFSLGVFVGRGTAPVRFDTNKLEKELASLKEAVIKKERFKINTEEIDQKIRLSFYEVLKETKQNFNIEQPENKKEPVPGTPEKTAPKIVDRKKAPPLAKNDAKGHLTLQLASLKDKKTAHALIERLKKKGYEAYLTTAVVPGKGTWYRVRIGSFDSREDAAGTLSRLKKDEINSILVQK